uniref:Uncharacterized protein n=1 Tax=Lactuca sativa TaxID=4236 RepID=A0A9R1V727_LACSA|nr:hypothetical protein LSAT_V11C600315990 [Lactuca sativa]
MKRGLAESRIWTRRVANLNVFRIPSLLGELDLQLPESKAKNGKHEDKFYVRGTRCYKVGNIYRLLRNVRNAECEKHVGTCGLVQKQLNEIVIHIASTTSKFPKKICCALHNRRSLGLPETGWRDTETS